tara:strand:+ start:4703 stop:5401 length:699 start_codon:yes stop_codon:yes gene_type:complete
MESLGGMIDLNIFPQFILTPENRVGYEAKCKIEGIRKEVYPQTIYKFKAVIFESNIPGILIFSDASVSNPNAGEYILNISPEGITINGIMGNFKLKPNLEFRDSFSRGLPGECYVVKTINEYQPQFHNKEITFCIIGGKDVNYRVYILKSNFPTLVVGNIPRLIISREGDKIIYTLGPTFITRPVAHRFKENEYNDDLTLKGGGKKYKKHKSKKRRKSKSKKRKRKTRRKRR